MTDPLTDAVVRRIERAASGGITLGEVTAVDPTSLSLTVALPGGTVASLRWVEPYSTASPPQTGDFVAVARDSGGWAVLGRLSRDLTAPPFVDVQTLLAADVVMRAKRDVAPTSGAWGWTGDRPAQGESRYPGGYRTWYAGLGLWRLSLPLGATVTACRLRIRRRTGIDPPHTINSSTLVTPAIYGTAVAPGSLPTTQDPATLTTTPVWEPGSIERGQAASWDLPSAWLADLLSGAMTGIIFRSTAVAQSAWWDTPELDLSYRVPA